MIFEQYAGELIAFATGIAGIIIGKITNRKREKVDVEELEVRITDKLLKIIMGDIVEPLRQELAIVREDLKMYKNAYKKKYTCRNNADCPIGIELQKQQDTKNRQLPRRIPVTNRQREPVGGEDNETDHNSIDDSADDNTAGLFGPASDRGGLL